MTLWGSASLPRYLVLVLLSQSLTFIFSGYCRWRIIIIIFPSMSPHNINTDHNTIDVFVCETCWCCVCSWRLYCHCHGNSSIEHLHTGRHTSVIMFRKWPSKLLRVFISGKEQSLFPSLSRFKLFLTKSNIKISMKNKHHWTINIYRTKQLTHKDADLTQEDLISVISCAVLQNPRTIRVLRLLQWKWSEPTKNRLQHTERNVMRLQWSGNSLSHSYCTSDEDDCDCKLVKWTHCQKLNVGADMRL